MRLVTHDLGEEAGHDEKNRGNSLKIIFFRRGGRPCKKKAGGRGNHLASKKKGWREKETTHRGKGDRKKNKIGTGWKASKSLRMGTTGQRE